MNTQTQETVQQEENPVDVMTSKALQVQSYTREERAEHQNYLNALNAAWEKVRITKSEKVRNQQTATVVVALAWFRDHQVGLKAYYARDEEPPQITSFGLMATKEEARANAEWEIDYIVKDAERDVQDSRKELKRRIQSLIGDMQSELHWWDEAEKKGETYRVSSHGILQGSAVEIDRLCHQIDEQEKRAAQVKRMAKLAAKM